MKKNILNLFLLFFIGFTTFLSCAKDDEFDYGNDAKEILSFTFLKDKNKQLGEDVKAIINNGNKTISLVVPNGTDVTAINPTIKISENATISPRDKIEMDFSKEVTYTVKAENGSTQKYGVVVKVAESSDKPNTAYEFKAKNNELLEVNIEAEVSFVIPTWAYYSTRRVEKDETRAILHSKKMI